MYCEECGTILDNGICVNCNINGFQNENTNIKKKKWVLITLCVLGGALGLNDYYINDFKNGLIKLYATVITLTLFFLFLFATIYNYMNEDLYNIKINLLKSQIKINNNRISEMEKWEKRIGPDNECTSLLTAAKKENNELKNKLITLKNMKKNFEFYKKRAIAMLILLWVYIIFFNVVAPVFLLNSSLINLE